MNALDVTARGLARRAIDNGQALQGPTGAAILKHRRGEAAALIQPVSSILDRLDMSPAGFGALYNAGTSDYSALSAFTAAIASAAEGLVKLQPRTHYLGQVNATERLEWTQSNAGLVGAGIDKTIIRNMTTTADTWSLYFGAACENVLFSDMTFHGRVGCYSGTNSVKSVIFNRCKFTTDPTVLHHAVQFVADTMTTGVQYIYFIDCIFYNSGAMGCEMANHGAGSTVRIGNLYFIRPRFIGAGQASAAFGMGLSLTGYGDQVILDRPWFDGNKQYHLENAGYSRLRVRDMMVRQSTHPTGKNCISMSTNRQMYDNEIDGFELVGDLGSNLADRPAVDAPVMDIRSNTRLRLNRIKAAVNNPTGGQKVILLQNNVGDVVDATVENCDLWSNSNGTVLEFLSTSGNHIVQNNILTNTSASRTTALVAAYGSGNVKISQNRISYASGTAASVFLKSGTGSLDVRHDNIGITTRYRGTHTIAAGAVSSASVAHGLPGMPSFVRAYAQADCGGTTWPVATSTNIQANIGRPAKTTVLTGSKTYDAPSLADGAATSTTVTVTGATLGDLVEGVGLGVSAGGLTVTAMVTAANTVTVVIFNKSGAVVDLLSTTLSVSVLHVTATSVTVDIEAEYAW